MNYNVLVVVKDVASTLVDNCCLFVLCVVQVAHLTRLNELSDAAYADALKRLKSDHMILSQLVKIVRTYEDVLQRALGTTLGIYDDFYPNTFRPDPSVYRFSPLETDQFAWGVTLSALATDPPRAKLQEVVDFYTTALGLSCADLKDLTGFPCHA